MKGIKEGFTRRGFIKATALIGLIGSVIPDVLMPKKLFAAAESGKKAANPKSLTPEEALHIPTVDIPLIAEDGSLVPITVSVNHPMTADHYIKSIYIVDDLSPIPARDFIDSRRQMGRPILQQGSNWQRVQISAPLQSAINTENGKATRM